MDAPDLYHIPGGKLDKFIEDNLQPDGNFQFHVRKAVNIICEFLRENCFKDSTRPQARVLKVVKGGSSGKGTALKWGSDANLVLFLNVFKDYKDQRENRPSIIREIMSRFIECQKERTFDVVIELSKQENPQVLGFKLHSSNYKESIEFDVQPAFDALGQYTKDYRPDPQVYINLINSHCDGGEFSVCFTELQKKFIVSRPAKLKSLIRLVKHWYKEKVSPLKLQLKRGESLPPKYALELLAVYAWEQGGEKTDFKMAEGFRTVLWLIQQYRRLQVFWTTNYDFKNETLKQYLQNQLRKPRPVILDPADPTGIVGEGSRWDLLAREAERCSLEECCWLNGVLVQLWNVPVEKVTGGSVPAIKLYDTEAQKLDKFIYDYLQPDSKFLDQLRMAVDLICQILRENCFRDDPPPRRRVLKVVKGGSLGKGTALKGVSDADLVLFVNVLKAFTDQVNNRKEIIQKIEERLKECKEKEGLEVHIKPSKWENPRVVSFTLRFYDFEDSVEFDVLPAFDALGQFTRSYKPHPQVYLSLINLINSSSSRSRGGDFSSCFTELQKDFIIDRPTKLKSLIRLVKYWYKEKVCPLKWQCQKGESLPPKYALELMAVYAWEQGGKKTDFKMAEGFRTVLWLIQQHEELCLFWTKNYDFENEILKQYLQKQLQKPRPVILDPADPTGMLGEGSRWDLLAKEAGRCSDQTCCTDRSGVPVPHWDVPVVSPEIQLLHTWCHRKEVVSFHAAESPLNAACQDFSLRGPIQYPYFPQQGWHGDPGSHRMPSPHGTESSSTHVPGAKATSEENQSYCIIV